LSKSHQTQKIFNLTEEYKFRSNCIKKSLTGTFRSESRDSKEKSLQKECFEQKLNNYCNFKEQVKLEIKKPKSKQYSPQNKHSRQTNYSN